MPRPKNNRIVQKPPVFTEFKPMGVAGRLLKQVSLSLDEYEAFRLADFLGFSHAEAAMEMDISRPTFTRLITSARKKIASLIIQGNLLIIEGGSIHFRKNIIQCMNCGHMFDIDIKSTLKACPDCNSKSLVNLAGGFGHGRCCTDKYAETKNEKQAP